MKSKKGDLVYIKSDSLKIKNNMIWKVGRIIGRGPLFYTVDIIIGCYGYIDIYVNDLILLKESDEVQKG